MKHYTFPHLAVDVNWSLGIVIYNSGVNPERFVMTLNNQSTIHEINAVVTAKNRVSYTDLSLPESIVNGGAFAVNILCSDNVMPVIGMFLINQSGGFADSNFITPVTIQLPDSIAMPVAGVDTIITKYHHEFLGQDAGQYLLPKYANILYYCTREDWINNYDKQVLGIGDCSTPDGSPLFGHPQGTHYDGKQFDLNYPTNSGGYTHYTPYGTLMTPIVVQGNVTNNFDYNRFVYFCMSMKKFCPGMKVNVHNIIRDYIIDKIPSMNNDWFLGDSQDSYNHDKHAHFKMA